MTERHKNADGTYNGVTFFAELTGLSQSEIAWTFNRTKHLIQVEKKTKDEAKAIVREEAKTKPWLMVRA